MLRWTCGRPFQPPNHLFLIFRKMGNNELYKDLPVDRYGVSIKEKTDLARDGVISSRGECLLSQA